MSQTPSVHVCAEHPARLHVGRTGDENVRGLVGPNTKPTLNCSNKSRLRHNLACSVCDKVDVSHDREHEDLCQQAARLLFSGAMHAPESVFIGGEFP